MAKLEVTEDQLHLIQRALDFYSRIGIGQFDQIKDHPTFEKHLYKEFALGSGDFNVGDKTTRGEVVEVCPRGEWIKTKGSWSNGEEIRRWEDIENIRYSTDYTRYHQVRETVDNALVHPRNMLYNNIKFGNLHGGWGIHHPNVDDSCREAFDIIQVIRHEFWKRNENRSSITVDSSIHFTSNKGESNKIKCELWRKN